MTIIRKATIAESGQILPMWIKLMEFHADKNVVFNTTPDFKEKVIHDIEQLFNKPNVVFFVVEKEKELVGFCLTTIATRPSVFAKTTRGYIGDTYIDERFRGQGIGTNLILTIKAWFKEQGVDFADLQVTKTNEAGKRFWEKNGFELVNFYMVNDLK